MKRLAIASIFAASLAALAGPCWGQYQVNYRTYQGQALDRSPQVGSGGFNGGGGVGQYGTFARDSSLMVTGQVTGLAGFRGQLGYTPSDQWQGTLPSASLSSFIGRSVGMQDVLAGNTLGPVPYFDQSKTILKAPAIVAGLAMPGTNVPLTPTVDPSVRSLLGTKTYVDALADYRSVMATTPGNALSASPMEVPPAIYVPSAIQDVPAAALPQQFVNVMEGVDPGRGMLLQLLKDRDRSELGQALYLDLKARKAALAATDSNLASKAYVESNYLTLAQQLGGEPSGPNPLLEPNSFRYTKNVSPRPGEANVPPGAKENVDAFYDLLEKMRQKREGIQPAQPRLGIGRDANVSRLGAPLPPGIVELEPGRQIVIHSLAGRGLDLSNRNLTQAEIKLKSGKFYEAADAYAMAASLNPKNPLPHVGKALALLGAGEPVSAGREIRAALEVFPSLMDVRLDFGSLMDITVFRERLAELDARLQQPEEDRDPALPLLACYLNYNHLDLEKAKLYAKEVQAGPSQGKIVETFTELVLTGKHPTTQPASAPTTAPSESSAILTPGPSAPGLSTPGLPAH